MVKEIIQTKYSDIIGFLRSNSREKITNISKILNQADTTTYDRLKVINSKYIKKYTALIDYNNLGFIRVKILLNTRDKTDVTDFIHNNLKINSAFKLKGNYDFLLDCIFENEDDLEVFTKSLDKLPIISRQVFVVTNEIKVEDFLNNR